MHSLWIWNGVRGPYVVTLKRTLIFEWYLQKLLVKNGHENDMCDHEIGLCAQNIGTTWGSTVNITIGRGYVIAYRERESLHWPSTTFCILWNSDSETWKWVNLHDLQLLTWWDISWFYPIARIVCGVGSAHNRAMYLNIKFLLWFSDVNGNPNPNANANANANAKPRTKILQKRD
jgi:hypothetical protein